MNEEIQEEKKLHEDLDFTKLKKDKDEKYIVTEDLDPTPIQFAIADETFTLQPERYSTRKKAEKELAKLEGTYTIVETR